MALYKTEKVNPLAGCAPTLLQIPVFYALYKVLMLTIEMRRAVHRIDARRLPKADVELGRVSLVGLSDAVVEMASRLPDAGLRSLDAIHVATARLVRDDLTAMISYDKRMIAVAHSEGLPVVSPGDGA